MKIPQGIKRNISLKNYSTFKIGGKARFFVEVKTLEHLISVLQWAKTNQCPFFILGNGSNTLFSDKGYEGLIIKINNSEKPEIFKKTCLITAGTLVATFLTECVKNRWQGFEWLAGIPGTIGGVIYGNAGAFGCEIKDYVKKVIVLNLKTLKLKTYSKAQCKFHYRESIFKKLPIIIWQVEFKIKKGKKNIIQQKIHDNWQYKIRRHLFEYPSAGSVFKNIIIKDNPIIKKISKAVPIKGGKVSAGWFIDECGLKGHQYGGAQIANFHSNVIINVKNAKASDILHLIKLMKDKVWKKFKIKLQEEIIIT